LILLFAIKANYLKQLNIIIYQNTVSAEFLCRQNTGEPFFGVNLDSRTLRNPVGLTSFRPESVS
jgi:hypothetical protein